MSTSPYKFMRSCHGSYCLPWRLEFVMLLQKWLHQRTWGPAHGIRADHHGMTSFGLYYEDRIVWALVPFLLSRMRLSSWLLHLVATGWYHDARMGWLSFSNIKQCGYPWMADYHLRHEMVHRHVCPGVGIVWAQPR